MLLKSLYTSLQEILEQQYDHYHQDDQEAAGWRQRAGGSGPGPCGFSGPMRPGLCSYLNMDLREFIFPDVG
jgi:hypothetical protein